MTDKSFFSRALSLVVAGSLLCLSAAPGLAQSAPAQKAPAKGEEFIIIIDGKEPNKLQIFGPSVKPKTAPQQTVPNPAVDPKAPTPTVDPNSSPA